MIEIEMQEALRAALAERDEARGDADALRSANTNLGKALGIGQKAMLAEERIAHAATKSALALATERARAAEERLRLLDVPEICDFMVAVPREATHQRGRWGSDHDDGKTPADWFWLIGYLAGKALHAHAGGHTDKALHHTITVAAACANWHAAILGKTDMRPGIIAPTPASDPLRGAAE